MNKLNIEVDAGYAFDYLAILIVKEARDLVDFNVVDNCAFNIAEQIGNLELFESIVHSAEFENLIMRNSDTFDLVDKARKSPATDLAKQVDDSNQERFYAKKALQKKFFGSDMTIEKKS